MKVNLNVRDKTWVKAVVAVALAFAFAVLMIVAGASERSWLMVVAAVFLALLFGLLLFGFISPRMWVCMRAVKGQMSYRELKSAIATEDFCEPIHTVFFAFIEPVRLLLSENWLLLGAIDTSSESVCEADDPICIPKSSVTSIEAALEHIVYMDEDEYPSDELDDYSKAYADAEVFYVFKFGCGARQEFRSGLVPLDALDAALAVLKDHFPQIKVKVLPLSVGDPNAQEIDAGEREARS